LDFSGNKIVDISALENLTNLKVLDFRDNEVSDINSLANLINLSWLGFQENKVSDINSLANLINLRWLRFQENKVSDISPLVENEGFGDGDRIYMLENQLDLAPGSEDMYNINTLIDRGVRVEYEPQN